MTLVQTSKGRNFSNKKILVKTAKIGGIKQEYIVTDMMIY